MKISVEWEHIPESEWDLEHWFADVNDVRLVVVKIAGDDYDWQTNGWGNWKVGCEDTLEAAMLSAIDAVLKREEQE